MKQYAELVQEVKSDKRQAQDALFNLFSGRMFILCRRYIKSTRDAEEMMLDGFCQVLMNLKHFDYQTDGGFITWMNTIITNVCLGYLRRKKKIILVADTEAKDVKTENDIVDRLSAEELYKVILTLPEGCGTVFNLFVIDGFEHKEIAIMMDIAEATSRTQLLHARKLLQKKVNANKGHHERIFSK